MNLLLTGSNGFIGRHLLYSLKKISELDVAILSRNDNGLNKKVLNVDLLDDFELSDYLKYYDVVIHVAAMANANELDDSVELFKMNVDSTLRLAQQSALAGVKRFIFISTIKVNGESTEMDTPFDMNVSVEPLNQYGLSKYLAESGLKKISSECDLEVVIIRPPLVYGPGVKANFASLMNLVSKGIPLPFGCITHNQRSLVSVTNLVDLIITCIDHPKAANQVFLVSDDHDVSTSEMIWCYRFIGKLFNKSDVVDRLTGSLQVDISHTKETLGWKPPQTLQEGFKQTAQAFLQAKTK